MIREKGFMNIVADIVIIAVLALVFLTCVLPFVYEMSVSLSGRVAVQAQKVGLFPVDFTTDNYAAVVTKDRFITALIMSSLRVGIAVPATLFVVVLTAYPMSLEKIHLRGRRTFMTVMIFVNLFQVGLIPRYLSYAKLGLIDNFLVLILPGLLATFNVILVISYFRGLPYELIESAMLDGARHWDILFKVMVPLSMPVLATIAMFTFVAHWNAWFDGIIYLRDLKLWPLQSYLYTVLTTQSIRSEFSAFRFSGILPNVSPGGAEAAMVFFAALPVLIAYPLIQRYIITGMTIGAVKE